MTFRAQSVGFVAGLGLVAPLIFSACGGTAPQDRSPAGIEKRDEGKADRLLSKARESGQVDDFRKVVDRFGGTPAAESAREDLAGILLGQAAAAVKKGDFPVAEELAQEVKIYAGLDKTEEANKVLTALDEKRSDEITAEATEFAKAGRCASALKQVAGPLGKKPRARFKKMLQTKTRAALVDCLKRRMQKEIDGGNLEAARMLVETSQATIALDKQGYDDAYFVLEKFVVAQITTSIQPMLIAKKWEEAISELDRLQVDNKLTKREHEVAFALVQDALFAALMTDARAALAAKNPGARYEKLEALEKLARWKATPDDLQAVYDLMRIAIECEANKCKMQSARAAWSWGLLDIHPADEIGSKAKSRTTHAQKVWVVGKSRTHSLIVLKDTKSARGEELLQKVAGWVENKRLKSRNTELWLHPLDQLVGVQVWAPLRAPAPGYHLGIVKEIIGKTVQIERLSDRQAVTVPLSTIRVGTLKKGLRVMAFCVDKLHPEEAKIDRIVTHKGGGPKVNVICKKGKKELIEGAPSLTSKKAWLPPRKP